MEFLGRACSRGYPPFEIIILLLAFVPSSSAQSHINPSSVSPSPTTLQTSPSPSPTNPNPSPATSTTTASHNSSDDVSDYVFNYYFLIIAAVAIVFAIVYMYIKSRKKRKAALIRSRSQRALARDMEGFRQRFGMGRTGGMFYGTHNWTGSAPEEGLDDRGEAPPPYVPGSKPPSLRSTDGVFPGPPELDRQSWSRNGDGEVVEMQNIGRIPRTQPPGYDEHAAAEPDAAGNSDEERRNIPDSQNWINLRQSTAVGHETSGITDAPDSRNIEITRPAIAITASERFSSTRRS